mgnify:CR=1 FL=1
MKHVIVIGGGAAGCMAAVAAAQKGAAVTLLERNPKLGRKLYITGKGRCNVTNDCAAPEVLQNVPRNSRFLTSAVTRFPPEAVKAFFEGLGVPLKTERGNRVFPCSDKAADIIDALLLALRRSGVHIVQDRARALRREGEILTGVEGERGFYPGGAVVIATGGVSYPLTGSTGDGYALAVALGHTILPPRGSLVPLVAEGDACAKMQGLSLRNVAIQVRNSKKKTVYAGQGELLFTHFGLSGPLILSASAHMRDFDTEHYYINLDLKPALDEEKLDRRLLRDFEENANRDFHNVLEGLVPRLMVPVLVFAPQLTAFFNRKAEVVAYGTLLLRYISPFYLLCCINQIYSGALRGAGNSQVPMVIMLGSFVVFRQIYLYIMSHYISNALLPLAMGYPAGWLVCSAATLLYYRRAALGRRRLVEDN